MSHFCGRRYQRIPLIYCRSPHIACQLGTLEVHDDDDDSGVSTFLLQEHRCVFMWVKHSEKSDNKSDHAGTGTLVFSEEGNYWFMTSVEEPSSLMEIQGSSLVPHIGSQYNTHCISVPFLSQWPCSLLFWWCADREMLTTHSFPTGASTAGSALSARPSITAMEQDVCAAMSFLYHWKAYIMTLIVEDRSLSLSLSSPPRPNACHVNYTFAVLMQQFLYEASEDRITSGFSWML